LRFTDYFISAAAEGGEEKEGGEEGEDGEDDDDDDDSDDDDVQVTIGDIKTSTTYTSINLKRGLNQDKNKVKLLKRSDFSLSLGSGLKSPTYFVLI
jgi:hypothetical protein